MPHIIIDIGDNNQACQEVQACTKTRRLHFVVYWRTVAKSDRYEYKSIAKSFHPGGANSTVDNKKMALSLRNNFSLGRGNKIGLNGIYDENVGAGAKVFATPKNKG